MINLGKIRYLGISSGSGFLNYKTKLDLNKIIELSSSVLKSDRFKFLQVPYNLIMPDHLTKKTQLNLEKKTNCSLMYLAAKKGIDVITNAPLQHGKLVSTNYPDELKKMFKNSKTNVDLSLKFSLSNPGSNSTLIGVTNKLHLDEIISILRTPLISLDDYSTILGAK